MNWHGRQLPATHNVIAEFSELSEARHAIEVLQRAGIDAGDIALLGSAADTAERKTRAHIPRAGRTRIARGMLLGGTLGLVAGTLIGWISGAAFTDGRITTAVITGGLAGLVGGALFGAMAALALGDAWEMSQQTAEGRVAVNVGSDDADTIRRAHERLEHEHPERVLDFDENDLRSKPDETRWVIDLIEAQNSSSGPIAN